MYKNDLKGRQISSSILKQNQTTNNSETNLKLLRSQIKSILNEELDNLYQLIFEKLVTNFYSKIKSKFDSITEDMLNIKLDTIKNIETIKSEISKNIKKSYSTVSTTIKTYAKRQLHFNNNFKFKLDNLKSELNKQKSIIEYDNFTKTVNFNKENEDCYANFMKHSNYKFEETILKNCEKKYYNNINNT